MFYLALQEDSKKNIKSTASGTCNSILISIKKIFTTCTKLHSNWTDQNLKCFMLKEQKQI